MTATTAAVLGPMPDLWSEHGVWSWDAEPMELDPIHRIPVRTGLLRGWTVCGCGFESTPKGDPNITPLPYAEAMQAYIDHLPPGMAAWLVKRQQAMPRTDNERVARVRALVELCDTDGATSVSVELVKEALGWYR